MNRANKINQVKNKIRHLKIQRYWRELKYNWQYYPELRVKGAWLELAGFEVGDQVQIEVRHNQLIITNFENQTSLDYDDSANQRAVKYPQSPELLWLGGE